MYASGVPSGQAAAVARSTGRVLLYVGNELQMLGCWGG